METAVKICQEDNVVVALKDLKQGDRINIDGISIALTESVKFGHKIAIRDIGKGDPVIKYCESIGVATADIRKGEHVHIHNLQSNRARR